MVAEIDMGGGKDRVYGSPSQELHVKCSSISPLEEIVDAKQNPRTWKAILKDYF